MLVSNQIKNYDYGTINIRKSELAKYIGKQVIWTSPGKNKKQIKGKVAAAHGNSGALRVIFEKGMPGQAICDEVKIE